MGGGQSPDQAGRAIAVRALTKNGVASGVSVGWHVNGWIARHSEKEDDGYHGWHLEWNEDGTKQVQAHYREGRLDNLN